jgi:hypothetical protein
MLFALWVVIIAGCCGAAWCFRRGKIALGWALTIVWMTPLALLAVYILWLVVALIVDPSIGKDW